MLRNPEQRVYSCDRCGAFFAKDKNQSDKDHPYHAKAARLVIERHVPPTRQTSRVVTDLCGECAEGFQHFVKGPCAK